MDKIILRIDGMTCSACSIGLEKYLKKQRGIKSVSVNLILSIATIEYEGINVNTISEYIKNAGFKCLGEFNDFLEKEDKNEGIELGIATIFFLLVIIVSIFGGNKVILLVLSVFFIFYGRGILKSGLKCMINLIPNMDTLVLLSVVVSFFYSLYNLISGNNLVYLESICMIIYFVKLGRFIENNAKSSFRDVIEKLVQITPSNAIIMDKDKERVVTIDEIKKGDIVICRSGEKIAVDGVVVSGSTYIDESFITGESVYVSKNIGSKVIAGSINYNGVISYRADKIGKDSMISEIVRMVMSATTEKTKIQRITDKVSGYFVYVVMGIAVITLIFWLLVGNSLESAFSYFACVLVVACPCSLGLAVPLVVVNSSSICTKKGLFIKNSEVIELARNIDTVVFDKTGTLTMGKLGVYKLFNYTNYSDKRLLNIVGNIEKLSSHPIASSFSISKVLVVEDFLEISGRGVSSSIDGKKYYLGNRKILNELNIEDKNDDYTKLVSDGCSIVYVIEDKKIIGLIGVLDTVRENIKDVIYELKENNIRVMMLTGDNEGVASLVAKKLSIDEVVANVMPKDKALVIKELVDSGRCVMMVGDGINDSLALINATIGVGVNDGSDVSKFSSDVILMNNNMHNIINLIKISKKSYRVILENLFWAFCYNLCMIPIASGLFSRFGISISHGIASIFMVISSLLVVINSKLLKRRVEL